MDRLAQESREADARLVDRIEALVSAMAKYMAR